MAKTFSSSLPGGSSFDPKTGAMLEQPNPWIAKFGPGVYYGKDRSVWIYRVFPTAPYKWEDPDRRLAMGYKLAGLLVELGDTTRRPLANQRFIADYREFHLVALNWMEQFQRPESVPRKLADFLAHVYSYEVPNNRLFIGVKLYSNVKQSFRSLAERIINGIADDEIPTLKGYESEINLITGILARHGCTRPTRREEQWFEAWFDNGRSSAPVAIEESDYLDIKSADPIEFSAVLNFGEALMRAPSSPWIADAMEHAHGASVVSIRGAFEPPEVTRKRARDVRKRLNEAMKESADTHTESELGTSIEDENLAEFSQATEEYYATNRDASLTDVSIVTARRLQRDGRGGIVPTDESYLDAWRSGYGIDAKVLSHRQLWAYDEVQPASSRRLGQVKGYRQDLNIAMIAHSGITSSDAIGDSSGLALGITVPRGRPVLLDPKGSLLESKNPTLAIVGEPGSGKAQPDDALVAVPGGWKPISELTVGDHVIGSDGHPTPVVGVFPQGERPVYRVGFRDGSFVECDDEHLWQVRKPGSDWRVLTLAEIRESLTGTPGWRIPVVAPVHHPGRPDLDDPYTAGQAHATSGTRFPAGYLTGSVEQRFAFLQGVLDAVGQVTEPGTVTVPSLQDTDVPWFTELVWSLGGIVSVDKHPELNGRMVATLVLPGALGVPFRFSPAGDRYEPGSPEVLEREITEVVFVGYKPARCIKVAAADQLYCTEHYIVTHNTFIGQALAFQSIIAGNLVVYINPKGFDSLAPFARVLGGEVIPMSRLEKQGGAFDPFRFADSPITAAEIASSHITSVFAPSWRGTNKEIRLAAGLKRAAERGARCVRDALTQGVDDPEIVHDVLEWANASTLFALGIGNTPQPPLGFGNGLVLIEFDRDMDMPLSGASVTEMTRSQASSVAAISLVCQASFESVLRRGSGSIFIDEAHLFASHERSVAAIEKFCRLGRSLGLMLVLQTQRLGDITSRGIDAFLSRVLLMRLRQREEAAAGLRLCGLEPTEERINMLREFGPVRPNPAEGIRGRPSLAMHLDMFDRHAVVQLGPFPEWMRILFSTQEEYAEERQRIMAELVERGDFL